MCGIIGRVGTDEAIDSLLTGLENLEYRGYDSAGVAIQNGAGIKVQKRSGKVNELKSALEDTTTLEGEVGIGHTRWSTHGPPTDENAHPHTDSTRDVAVVHNGIIENYGDLKGQLEAAGHEFTSDTDTEVIPHLMQRYLDAGFDSERAFRGAIDQLEGSYAVAAMVAGEHVLYAARQGSPLVVGLDDDGFFLASDVPAFLEYTDDVVYLEDGDVVVVEPDRITFTDATGDRIDRTPETVEWDPEQAGKGAYDHYMHKEIHEQPTALTQALEGRVNSERGEISLESVPAAAFEGVDRVQFIACGTSYHASLYGSIAMNRVGIPTSAHLANEYGTSAPPADDRTLVIAVTQSGETADTLSAMRHAREQGARLLTVTNVVGSTATRRADDVLLIRAGPEIGVAATKTFSSQAAMLVLLARRLASDFEGASSMSTTRETGGGREDLETLIDDLQGLPRAMQSILESDAAERLAEQYLDARSYFFIGRGLGYPVALEGALKFKEITYEHAEGFAAGELKHGPLALVTSETPVVAVFTGDADGKVCNNAEEAQTRGAPLIAVCPANHRATEIADAHLEIPAIHPALAGLLANVQLQLLSYQAAAKLGRPIDKPRNLAKSVTVE